MSDFFDENNKSFFNPNWKAPKSRGQIRQENEALASSRVGTGSGTLGDYAMLSGSLLGNQNQIQNNIGNVAQKIQNSQTLAAILERIKNGGGYSGTMAAGIGGQK